MKNSELQRKKFDPSLVETVPEHECVECGGYVENSSWCESCLDKVDVDAYEEQKRGRIFESEEY